MTAAEALSILERDDSTRAERFAAVDSLLALDRLLDSSRAAVVVPTQEYRYLVAVERLAKRLRLRVPLGAMAMVEVRDLCDRLDEGPRN